MAACSAIIILDAPRTITNLTPTARHRRGLCKPLNISRLWRRPQASRTDASLWRGLNTVRHAERYPCGKHEEESRVKITISGDSSYEVLIQRFRGCNSHGPQRIALLICGRPNRDIHISCALAFAPWPMMKAGESGIHSEDQWCSGTTENYSVAGLT